MPAKARRKRKTPKSGQKPAAKNSGRKPTAKNAGRTLAAKKSARDKRGSEGSSGKGSRRRPTPSSTARSVESMRQQFLETFTREHACTLKVLRAFPSDQSEFRPHPRANSARELAYTFVIEQMLLSLALKDQLRLGGGMPKPPESFRAIVDQFDEDFHALVALIESLPEAQWSTTVTFPVGPGKLGEWGKMPFAWFMLSDQIHHRGQYTTYLRMVGGKVPSIYGPSGDEPWF